MKTIFRFIIFFLCLAAMQPATAQDSARLDNLSHKVARSEKREARAQKKAERREKKLAHQQKKANRRARKTNRAQRKLEREQRKQSGAQPPQSAIFQSRRTALHACYAARHTWAF